MATVIFSDGAASIKRTGKTGLPLHTAPNEHTRKNAKDSLAVSHWLQIICVNVFLNEHRCNCVNTKLAERKCVCVYLKKPLQPSQVIALK